MRFTTLVLPLAAGVLPFVCASPVVVRRALDINTTPTDPSDDICGAIVNLNLDEGYTWFLAEDVVACLLSVPFHSDPATRFVKYLQQRFQFHATTAYLKNPPEGYQQPSVDLLGGLDQILSKIANNFYHNQYAFEVDVLELLQKTHDGHVAVFAGITSAFQFAAPFDIVSVSADGKTEPDIYIYEDLIRQVTQKSPAYQASPIQSINGKPVTTFLDDIASIYAYGLVEPHADWNQLMSSAAQDITGLASVLSGNAPYFVGGNYNLTVTFRNGTTPGDYQWLSYYNSPGYTGPLETGGDFFNYFGLGFTPANFVEESEKYYKTHPSLVSDSIIDQDESNATSWNGAVPAYPANTITHQPDLGISHTGSVTGYYLDDISTAVLSLPTFDFYGDGIDSFSDTVAYFVQNATQRNATRVVIDLQANAGGQVALAIDAFRYLFPKKLPVLASRMRSHPLANVLGQAITSWAQTLPREETSEAYQAAVASEWFVTDRVNAATDREFGSWAEYYGPFALRGDNFSAAQQYNLSNPTFDRLNFNVDFPDCFFAGSCAGGSWDAQDIVLLTDGLCASTCSLFVEMMHQMGVRSVVMGGKPEAGPMQTASGSRGAAAYNSGDLDYDFMLAGNLSSAAASQAPSQDTGLIISHLGWTLRDQVRDASATPNQMLYMPADCRLYWTIANFYDYNQLWHDVVRAIFEDPSRCVPASTNVKTAPKRPTSPTSKRSLHTRDTSGVITDYIAQGLDLERLVDPSPGVEDGVRGDDFILCESNDDCEGLGLSCLPFPFKCTADSCTDRSCAGGSAVTRKVCSRNCPAFQSNQGLTGCPQGLGCPPTGGSSHKQRSLHVGNTRGGGSSAPSASTGNTGTCEPNWKGTAVKTLCTNMNGRTIRQKLLGQVSLGPSSS